jgi:hypothetical protein
MEVTCSFKTLADFQQSNDIISLKTELIIIIAMRT